MIGELICIFSGTHTSSVFIHDVILILKQGVMLKFESNPTGNPK